MEQETDDEEKECYARNISLLEHMINEKEKLITSIETGEIYNLDYNS